MNLLSERKAALLLEALGRGESLRAAAKVAGCAKNTAARYIRLYGRGSNCPCGAKSGHNGWCTYRYLQSPARQAFVKRCKAVSRWRFTPGRPATDPLVEQIKAVLPDWMPRQVRDEVIQDIALAVLSGEVSAENMAAEVKRFTSAVFKQYPTKFGPRSLDQPFRHGDTRLLREMV